MIYNTVNIEGHAHAHEPGNRHFCALFYALHMTPENPLYENPEVLCQKFY
jgi:hypothetical protein